MSLSVNYFGNEDLAREHYGEAMQLLYKLENRKLLGGLSMLWSPVHTLPDGTTIKIESIHDKQTVWINAPFEKRVVTVEEIEEVSGGKNVHPVLFDADSTALIFDFKMNLVHVMPWARFEAGLLREDIKGQPSIPNVYNTGQSLTVETGSHDTYQVFGCHCPNGDPPFTPVGCGNPYYIGDDYTSLNYITYITKGSTQINKGTRYEKSILRYDLESWSLVDLGSGYWEGTCWDAVWWFQDMDEYYWSRPFIWDISGTDVLGYAGLSTSGSELDTGAKNIATYEATECNVAECLGCCEGPAWTFEAGTHTENKLSEFLFNDEVIGETYSYTLSSGHYINYFSRYRQTRSIKRGLDGDGTSSGDDVICYGLGVYNRSDASKYLYRGGVLTSTDRGEITILASNPVFNGHDMAGVVNGVTPPYLYLFKKPFSEIR